MGLFDYVVKCLTDTATDSIPLLDGIDPFDNSTYHQKEIDYSEIPNFKFDETSIVPLKNMLTDIPDEAIQITFHL